MTSTGLATIFSLVAKAKIEAPPYYTALKIQRWLLDIGLTVNSFTKEYGLTQTTMNGWAGKEALTKIEAGEKPPKPNLPQLRTVALVSGIPVDFWLDETAPYPMEPNFAAFLEVLAGVARSFPPADRPEWVRFLSNPAERERALASYRAAQTRAARAPVPRAS